MSWAEVAAGLPESESYTVNTHCLGPVQHHCQPRTVRADGHQIGCPLPEGLSVAFGHALRRPRGSRCLWFCLEICARAGLRATLSPSLATSLSPCRVSIGGQSIKSVSGGKERVKSSLPSRSVRRRPARVNASDPDALRITDQELRFAGGLPGTRSCCRRAGCAGVAIPSRAKPPGPRRAGGRHRQRRDAKARQPRPRSGRGSSDKWRHAPVRSPRERSPPPERSRQRKAKTIETTVPTRSAAKMPDTPATSALCRRANLRS